MSQVLVKPLAIVCQIVGDVVVGLGVAGSAATVYAIETTERTVKRIRNRRRAKLISTINAVIDRQVELGQLVRPTPTPA